MFASGRRRPRITGEVAAGLLVATGLVVALAAEILVGDPLVQRLDATLLPPMSPGHLLGTDSLGRDVLARLVFGARSAYAVAVASAGIALLGGTLVAALAAVADSRALDGVVDVIADVVLSFPTILLALVVGAVLSPGRTQVIFTLGIVYIPVVLRVASLEARRVVRRPDYRLSRALGSSGAVRVSLYVLPAILPQALVQAASLAALAIGTEAALSFLGLGTQPPMASWGLMLSEARRYLAIAPHLSLVPGFTIALLTFGFQYLSDRLGSTIARGRA